jgi:hypothetical protein
MAERLATEADVKEGRAVFFVTGDPSVKPLDLALPCCAIWNDTEKKRAVPVIVIQAVQSAKVTAVGFRFLAGGNGVCLLSELEILKGPDERFKEEPNQRPEANAGKGSGTTSTLVPGVAHP